MDAAMDVRVFVFEVDAAAIDDDLRHLRRRRVIEIHERLPVYNFTQHRKILADAFNSKRGADMFDGVCCYHLATNPMRSSVSGLETTLHETVHESPRSIDST